MEERLIISGNTKLIICSDSKRVIDTLDKVDYIRHIIPNLKIIHNFDINDKNLVRNHLLFGEPDYFLKDEETYVISDYGLINQGQICYLIYHLIQREFLKSGKFVLHGAAVKRDLESTILIAPSKMGKTTFSLELVLNYGFKIYGDDSIKIVLEPELRILGGNTHLGLNLRHKNHKSIKRFYQDTIPEYIDSEMLGIHTSEESRLKQVIFLEPNIFNGSYKKDITSEEGRIKLYEELVKEMRASGYCLLQSNLSLPSLDNNIYSRDLIKEINKSDIKIYIVSGSFQDVLNHLL